MDIDYVIAWVDGQDPKHIQARKEFAPASSRIHYEATTEERFHDNGEIYYHIASIIKYAPFIRRVFIITDNQKPAYLDSFAKEGLCEPSFLKIVSHDEIFAGLDAVRPTFNARAIEAVLWRIPELSEHFIYANDDFFLNAPQRELDFYRDGFPVLQGTMEPSENKRLKYRLRKLFSRVSSYQYSFPKYRMAQWKGAVLAGVTGSFLNVHHYPHPLRRSTFEDFFSENNDILRKQISYRYRDVAQFNSVSLANHLEISRYKVPVFPPAELAYIDFTKSKAVPAEIEKIRTGVTPYGCVQGWELFEPDTREQIRDLLTTKFQGSLPADIRSAFSGHSNRQLKRVC